MADCRTTIFENLSKGIIKFQKQKETVRTESHQELPPASKIESDQQDPLSPLRKDANELKMTLECLKDIHTQSTIGNNDKNSKNVKTETTNPKKQFIEARKSQLVNPIISRLSKIQHTAQKNEDDPKKLERQDTSRSIKVDTTRVRQSIQMLDLPNIFGSTHLLKDKLQPISEAANHHNENDAPSEPFNESQIIKKQENAVVDQFIDEARQNRKAEIITQLKSQLDYIVQRNSSTNRMKIPKLSNQNTNEVPNSSKTDIAKGEDNIALQQAINQINKTNQKNKLNKKEKEEVFKSDLNAIFKDVETYIESAHLYKKLNLYDEDTANTAKCLERKKYEEFNTVKHDFFQALHSALNPDKAGTISLNNMKIKAIRHIINEKKFDFKTETGKQVEQQKSKLQQELRDAEMQRLRKSKKGVGVVNSPLITAKSIIQIYQKMGSLSVEEEKEFILEKLAYLSKQENRQNLTERLKQIDTDNIDEDIKDHGRVKDFWQMDLEDSLVVDNTHGLLKKRQKTPKTSNKQAIRTIRSNMNLHSVNYLDMLNESNNPGKERRRFLNKFRSISNKVECMVNKTSVNVLHKNKVSSDQAAQQFNTLYHELTELIVDQKKKLSMEEKVDATGFKKGRRLGIQWNPELCDGDGSIQDGVYRNISSDLKESYSAYKEYFKQKKVSEKLNKSKNMKNMTVLEIDNAAKAKKNLNSFNSKNVVGSISHKKSQSMDVNHVKNALWMDGIYTGAIEEENYSSDKDSCENGLEREETSMINHAICTKSLDKETFPKSILKPISPMKKVRRDDNLSKIDTLDSQKIKRMPLSTDSGFKSGIVAFNPHSVDKSNPQDSNQSKTTSAADNNSVLTNRFIPDLLGTLKKTNTNELTETSKCPHFHKLAKDNDSMISQISKKYLQNNKFINTDLEEKLLLHIYDSNALTTGSKQDLESKLSEISCQEKNLDGDTGRNKTVTQQVPNYSTDKKVLERQALLKDNKNIVRQYTYGRQQTIDMTPSLTTNNRRYAFQKNKILKLQSPNLNFKNNLHDKMNSARNHIEGEWSPLASPRSGLNTDRPANNYWFKRSQTTLLHQSPIKHGSGQFNATTSNKLPIIMESNKLKKRTLSGQSVLSSKQMASVNDSNNTDRKSSSFKQTILNPNHQPLQSDTLKFGNDSRYRKSNPHQNFQNIGKSSSEDLDNPQEPNSKSKIEATLDDNPTAGHQRKHSNLTKISEKIYITLPQKRVTLKFHDQEDDKSSSITNDNTQNPKLIMLNTPKIGNKKVSAKKVSRQYDNDLLFSEDIQSNRDQLVMKRHIEDIVGEYNDKLEITEKVIVFLLITKYRMVTILINYR